MHMIRLQVKPKEVPKVPVIQECVSRSSIVRVPLVKSENESIKESEKMVRKSQGLCQKDSKKRKRRVKVRKCYKKVKPKTLGLAIIMPHPESQPPKPLTQNEILYHQWNQGGQQELISLIQGIWAP